MTVFREKDVIFFKNQNGLIKFEVNTYKSCNTVYPETSKAIERLAKEGRNPLLLGYGSARDYIMRVFEYAVLPRPKHERFPPARAFRR